MKTHGKSPILRYSRGVAAFALVIGMGVAVQTWAGMQWTANFDSDEAIFGLMTRHILQGDVPTYMYGNSYLGSLESLISAGFVKIFGENVLTVRMSALLLFAVFLIFHGIWVRRMWGDRAALVSLLFLAVPGWHILWWTYRPIGAFGAMFVFGTAALLLYPRGPSQGNWRHYVRLTLFGISAGLGFWSHPMTMVYFAALFITSFLQSPEWCNLYELSSRFFRRFLHREAKAVLPFFVLGLGYIGVLAFFSDSCKPVATFAAIQTLARILLIGLGGIVIATAFATSARRRHLAIGGGVTVLGFLLGDIPQLKAWLFYGVAPSLAKWPSCPTDLADRANLLTRQLIPSVWGGPVLARFREMSLLDGFLWGSALLIMLTAVIVFLFKNRVTLWSILSMSPLLPKDKSVALPSLLFVLPLLLALFGSNTTDIWSTRYLLIMWQASSVFFALLICRIASSKLKALSLVLLGFWVSQVGFGNLFIVGQTWKAQQSLYATRQVAELEGYLHTHNVDGGYSDYWVAYTLDFLTQERLTIAPFNGIDRCPEYSAKTADLSEFALILPVGAVPREADLRVESILGIQDRLEAAKRPILPHMLKRLGEARVRERQFVSNWDVWLLAGQQP